MTKCNNSVELSGIAAAAPAFSHENHAQSFYRFPLRVERLSGQADLIEILALSSALQQVEIAEGTAVRVMGQLRSFNNRADIGRRLIITVLANVLLPGGGEDCNLVRLSGTLCKPPTLRRTPLGRSICDMMLAVNRRYGRSDYLPCIAWGQLAMRIGAMQVGDSLTLEGRIQSRAYTKLIEGGSEERIAYEVSVMHLPQDGCPPGETEEEGQALMAAAETAADTPV